MVAGSGSVADPALPPDQGTTSDLLPEVSLGHPSAVQRCITRYSPLIWGLARRTTRNRADAEDAVQEVFLKLWRNAHRFDAAVASERAFVSMLARRCLIDHQRKWGRRLQTEVLDEGAITTVDPGHGQLERREIARRVMSRLSDLADDNRRILELKLGLDWSYRRIAKRFNLPIGTVKSQARRGMIKLRELLGDGDEPAAKALNGYAAI